MVSALNERSLKLYMHTCRKKKETEVADSRHQRSNNALNFSINELKFKKHASKFKIF